MSFSVEFHASSRHRALSHLGEVHLPPTIREFLREALTNMRHGGAVHVKTSGHLCDGSGSYERSWVDAIVVEPVLMLGPGEPDSPERERV